MASLATVVAPSFTDRGAKYFGCRKCYELTRVSCREAHQAERLERVFFPDRMDLWLELAKGSRVGKSSRGGPPTLTAFWSGQST
jgi:hypothetical protein